MNPRVTLHLSSELVSDYRDLHCDVTIQVSLGDWRELVSDYSSLIPIARTAISIVTGDTSQN
jgi:hypothetical protein